MRWLQRAARDATATARQPCASAAQQAVDDDRAACAVRRERGPPTPRAIDRFVIFVFVTFPVPALRSHVGKPLRPVRLARSSLAPRTPSVPGSRPGGACRVHQGASTAACAACWRCTGRRECWHRSTVAGLRVASRRDLEMLPLGASSSPARCKRVCASKICYLCEHEADSRSLAPLLQVTPINDRVCVKVAQAETKTRGGILLPSDSQRKPTSGAPPAGRTR